MEDISSRLQRFDKLSQFHVAVFPKNGHVGFMVDLTEVIFNRAIPVVQNTSDVATVIEHLLVIVKSCRQSDFEELLLLHRLLFLLFHLFHLLRRLTLTFKLIVSRVILISLLFWLGIETKWKIIFLSILLRLWLLLILLATLLVKLFERCVLFLSINLFNPWPNILHLNMHTLQL